MDVVAEEITDVSSPFPATNLSSAAKGKGRALPPVAPREGSRRMTTRSSTAGQEVAPVQPKRRGRLPKPGKLSFSHIFFFIKDLYSCLLAPVVFKVPVVFDNKRFSKYIVSHV